MAQIALLNALTRPVYILVAVIGAIIALAIYVYTQLITSFLRLDQWGLVLNSKNAIIPIIFAILFGVTLGYQAYLWNQKRCSLKKSAAGAGSSSATIFGLLLVSQCPECATLGFFLLPASLVGYFSRYSLTIDLLVIALLLYTLVYLGAFKITNEEKTIKLPVKKARK